MASQAQLEPAELRTSLESQVTQKNGQLYLEVAHNLLKVAHKYRPLAFEGGFIYLGFGPNTARVLSSGCMSTLHGRSHIVTMELSAILD